MPPKNEFKIIECSNGNGTVYINGVNIQTDDIPELDMSEAIEYAKDNFTITLNKSGTLEGRATISFITLLKLSGLWDYAYTYCPSGRVKHLMIYGKNNRVKIKNYRHAINLINKYLIRGWPLKDNLCLCK